MLPSLSVEPRVIESASGRLRIWAARPDVVFTVGEGRIEMAQGQAIMDAVDAAARAHPKRAVVVHDWLDVDSYEVAVQARMSAWGITVMRSLERVAIGVTSPLVALAVRTANLAAGNRFDVLDTRPKVLAAAQASLARR